MPIASVKPPPAREQERRTPSAPAWGPRPRSRDLASQIAWLLVVIKVLCLQNLNWIVSAAIHASIMLSVAAIAVHHHGKGESLGIEAGQFEGLGEQSFENVLGGDGNDADAGGGNPLEQAIESAGMSAESRELADLGEAARIGMSGTASGDGGEGGGSGGGSGGGNGPGIGLGAHFFGTKGAGKSFIYIVDMSFSMTTGRRFERAKGELVKSINKLTPEQKFYVFFFNDRTYPLFDPKPAKGMLAATPSNKQRALSWIRTRTPESTTNPNMALQQALEMSPDVIFLLTDGELDEARSVVLGMIRHHNKSNVVIHTIAFGDEEGAATLEAIAGENNGTFRFVK